MTMFMFLILSLVVLVGLALLVALFAYLDVAWERDELALRVEIEREAHAWACRKEQEQHAQADLLSERLAKSEAAEAELRSFNQTTTRRLSQLRELANRKLNEVQAPAPDAQCPGPAALSAPPA